MLHQNLLELLLPLLGYLQWSWKSNSQISSAIAIGADGTIYLGTNDWFVYALSSTGKFLYLNFYGSVPHGMVLVGSFKWRCKTGGTALCTPVEGHDGTVYVTSQDGYFNAVDSSGNTTSYLQPHTCTLM